MWTSSSIILKSMVLLNWFLVKGLKHKLCVLFCLSEAICDFSKDFTSLEIGGLVSYKDIKRHPAKQENSSCVYTNYKLPPFHLFRFTQWILFRERIVRSLVVVMLQSSDHAVLFLAFIPLAFCFCSLYNTSGLLISDKF